MLSIDTAVIFVLLHDEDYKYFFGMLLRRRLYMMYAPASMTCTAMITNTNMPMRGAEVEMTTALSA